MRVAQSQDVDTLDPWMATEDETFEVLRQVYEPLLDLDPATLRAVPLLATRWTVSSDGRTWTFTLRTGVRFHDGTPFDANAVVYNFDRGRQLPRLALDALIEGVAASDASTVVFTLRAPYGPILALLAQPAFSIVSPACVKDQTTSWATPATRCGAGTGPFRVEPGAWQSGTKIALTRNAGYWGMDADGRRLPYLDGITFSAVRDENARVGGLRASQVDVALALGAAGVRAVHADPNLVLARRPAFDLVFVGFGARSPLDNVDVRRAIAMALDRGGLVQGVYGGEAKPASQLIPPGLLGFDDSVTQFTPTDPAAAKKLLADKGLANGFAVDLWYTPEASVALPDPKRVPDGLPADLAKIGITATVRTEDAAAFDADARNGKLPLWIGARAPARADPDDFMGDAIPNDTVAQELLRRARGENDPSKRAELYKQVAKLVQQQVARVPLVHVSAPIGASRKVNGLVPRAVGGEPFAAIWMGQ